MLYSGLEQLIRSFERSFRSGRATIFQNILID